MLVFGFRYMENDLIAFDNVIICLVG